MQVLVTGGAGFIGSNIVRTLAKKERSITVLDNFSTGNIENLKDLNINLNLIRGDVADINSFEIEKPDVIFHEGIYSSSPMYRENPRLTAKALDDFIILLEYARRNNSQIIFASSSSIYNGLPTPHSEDKIPKITDFYTEARLGMERLAQLYHQFYGMKIIGLRYFSVYGPYEKAKGKYANVVSQFLWAMMKNQAPVIYGNGTQKRDFVYVEDVVDANLLALNAPIKFGIYNIGTGKYYTLNHLIKILNRKLKTNIKPVYVENRIKNYVNETLADIEKAKKELGFEARISLEEGIEHLIKLEKEIE